MAARFQIMKPTQPPILIGAAKKSIGVKLRQVLDVPGGEDVEREFMDLLKAADSGRGRGDTRRNSGR